VATFDINFQQGSNVTVNMWPPAELVAAQVGASRGPPPTEILFPSPSPSGAAVAVSTEVERAAVAQIHAALATLQQADAVGGA